MRRVHIVWAEFAFLDRVNLVAFLTVKSLSVHGEFHRLLSVLVSDDGKLKLESRHITAIQGFGTTVGNPDRHQKVAFPDIVIVAGLAVLVDTVAAGVQSDILTHHDLAEFNLKFADIDVLVHIADFEQHCPLSVAVIHCHRIFVTLPTDVDRAGSKGTENFSQKRLRRTDNHSAERCTRQHQGNNRRRGDNALDHLAAPMVVLSLFFFHFVHRFQRFALQFLRRVIIL